MSHLLEIGGSIDYEQILKRARLFKKNHEYQHLHGYILSTIHIGSTPDIYHALQIGMMRLGGTVYQSHQKNSIANMLINETAHILQHLLEYSNIVATPFDVPNLPITSDCCIVNCHPYQSPILPIASYYTILQHFANIGEIKLLNIGNDQSEFWINLRHLIKIITGKEITTKTISLTFNDSDMQYSYHSRDLKVKLESLKAKQSDICKALSWCDVAVITDRATKKGFNNPINQGTIKDLPETSIIITVSGQVAIHSIDKNVATDERIATQEQIRHQLPICMAILEHLAMSNS